MIVSSCASWNHSASSLAEYWSTGGPSYSVVNPVTKEQCAYCGRFQEFPKDGGCVGCGAPLRPKRFPAERGKAFL
jgi:hypothetical protein